MKEMAFPFYPHIMNYRSFPGPLHLVAGSDGHPGLPLRDGSRPVQLRGSDQDLEHLSSLSRWSSLVRKHILKC